jgi:hypothetical protein
MSSVSTLTPDRKPPALVNGPPALLPEPHATTLPDRLEEFGLPPTPSGLSVHYPPLRFRLPIYDHQPCIMEMDYDDCFGRSYPHTKWIFNKYDLLREVELETIAGSVQVKRNDGGGIEENLSYCEVPLLYSGADLCSNYTNDQSELTKAVCDDKNKFYMVSILKYNANDEKGTVDVLLLKPYMRPEAWFYQKQPETLNLGDLVLGYFQNGYENYQGSEDVTPNIYYRGRICGISEINNVKFYDILYEAKNVANIEFNVPNDGKSIILLQRGYDNVLWLHGLKINMEIPKPTGSTGSSYVNVVGHVQKFDNDHATDVNLQIVIRSPAGKIIASFPYNYVVIAVFDYYIDSRENSDKLEQYVWPEAAQPD